jgi:hypothetical protein
MTVGVHLEQKKLLHAAYTLFKMSTRYSFRQQRCIMSAKLLESKKQKLWMFHSNLPGHTTYMMTSSPHYKHLSAARVLIALIVPTNQVWAAMFAAVQGNAQL